MNNKKSISLTVVLSVVAVIQLFPLYWLVTYSLKTNAEILGDNVLGLPHDVQWGNYVTIFTGTNIPRYFLNSVFYASVTVLVVGLLSAMAAYALTRMRFRLQAMVFSVFVIGIMIPAHSALLPLFQILDQLGLKGGYLSLLLPYIAFALPMSIMIISGFYQSIPKELEEAACIDGCGIYRAFFAIIFPVIKPALATASIFTFLGSWNEFLFATTFLDDDKFRTLTVGIASFSGERMTDYGLIGAGLVVATIPTIMVYMFFSAKIQKSLLAGAVKG